jgi:hypothetical protein
MTVNGINIGPIFYNGDLTVRRQVRFLLWFLFIGCLFGFIVLCAYPIRDSRIRISMLFLVMIIWLSSLGLIWRSRKIRFGYLILTGCAILFLCMPSRTIRVHDLRACYVQSLQRYTSVDYMWGAESWMGIDCSGLIRQGFIDALWIYGLKTFNGALVRKGLVLWMYDSSAKALRDGYHSTTNKIAEAESINSLDSNQLEPGDFVVIKSGAHCLAYLGDRKWIQADPSAKKVVINQAPVTDSGWFEMPVCIMRWSAIESK